MGLPQSPVPCPAGAGVYSTESLSGVHVLSVDGYRAVLYFEIVLIPVM